MADKPAVVGGCFCGKVAYKTLKPVTGMSFCYCSMCQSVHGAPFAAFTNINRNDLVWTRTEGLLDLRLSNVATRTVCRSCHAPITMVYNAAPDEPGIVAASIDEEKSTAAIPEVKSHIYVNEKPSWYKITDNAPQHLGPPPYLESWLEGKRAVKL
ncbi:hypothetical protein FE257_001688 [Aspergillus nanangensis]|uniref:CENP-V/GFA domain-containing protein n=1 Tax=Aspergillus nanangensis TaxID=2582783 RepID=A0AAD4GPJ2_ASPNN|nr:hypothetical protein FE257_001688 [Aspergillus nanangensis]